MLGQLNHTIVSLIPKKNRPNRVEEFRPISCCNVIYKVISKGMTNRLGECLRYLIDPAQAGFISGRLMSDNIFLVQELLRRYNVQRNTERCFLNIDLAKAYDTISWEFLRFALVNLGFPDMFIQWVMECVSTTSYSIKVNDEIHGHFPGKRGPRQGDPLSPLLFVICMEFLSRLVRKETAKDGFNFHQNCESLNLSHLAFADNIVFFYRGDIGSVRIIMECLQKFENRSGLEVNVSKPAVFLASMPDAEAAEIVADTVFKQGTFPFRFLGVPITPHILHVAHYSPLLEKIRKHLNAWNKKHHSFAGRRELIASFL